MSDPRPPGVLVSEHEAQRAVTIHDTLLELVVGIEACLRIGCYAPALVIQYAAIDIVASLERDAMESENLAFRKWCDLYMEPEKSLGCSALDLWAARCGVLHAHSPHSDLSDAGRARLISYAHGDGAATKLRRLFAATGRDEPVVDQRNLLKEFRTGVERYLVDLEAHPKRLERVEERAATRWFAWMRPELVAAAMAVLEARSGLETP